MDSETVLRRGGGQLAPGTEQTTVRWCGGSVSSREQISAQCSTECSGVVSRSKGGRVGGDAECEGEGSGVEERKEAASDGWPGLYTTAEPQNGQHAWSHWIWCPLQICQLSPFGHHDPPPELLVRSSHRDRFLIRPSLRPPPASRPRRRTPRRRTTSRSYR